MVDATRARTHATPLPLQPLPHHVMDGKGLFTAGTDMSEVGKLLSTADPFCLIFTPAFRTDAQRGGKGEG